LLFYIPREEYRISRVVLYSLRDQELIVPQTYIHRSHGRSPSWSANVL